MARSLSLRRHLLSAVLSHITLHLVASVIKNFRRFWQGTKRRKGESSAFPNICRPYYTRCKSMSINTAHLCKAVCNVRLQLWYASYDHRRFSEWPGESVVPRDFVISISTLQIPPEIVVNKWVLFLQLHVMQIRKE